VSQHSSRNSGSQSVIVTPLFDPNLNVQTSQSNARSDFIGYDLESLRPISEISSRGSSYESWIPYDLPDIPYNLVIGDWEHLATGTHGSVRKVHMQFGNLDGIFCLKLFSEEWKEAYDREVEAYSLMIHRKVKSCIPEVYFTGALPIHVWNGDQNRSQVSSEGRDEMYYGITMEYFEDFREVDFEKMDAKIAMAVAKALTRIHYARIRHGDMQEQNVLLVRQEGSVRAVWIDFSCAWTNAYGKTLDGEWGDLLGDFAFKGVRTKVAPTNWEESRYSYT
jgi:hypothetical protein